MQLCSDDEILSMPPSLMFWINGGREGRVTLEKSWMDGSDKSSLAVLTAQEAHSLTADVAARRLYWISDFKKVSSGRKRQTGETVDSLFHCLVDRPGVVNDISFRQNSFLWFKEKAKK